MSRASTHLRRLRARLRGGSLLPASCLLLGVCGATYILTKNSNIVQLDSDKGSKSLKHLQRRQADLPLSPFDALNREKSLHHGLGKDTAGDVHRLYEYAESVRCAKGVGISRYDATSVGRSARSIVADADRS